MFPPHNQLDPSSSRFLGRRLHERSLSGALFVCLLTTGVINVRGADALDRMSLGWLQQTRMAVEHLAKQRKPVLLKTGYTDYRAVIHMHSHFSHDSRGTIKEILQAAHRTGVRIIMFTEHPAKTYDYFNDGHHGLKEDVLLIPGAEQGGLLKFPTRSIQDHPAVTPQAHVDLVRSTGGQVFLSHLEERMDWNLSGLTGNEIYNIHADFKDERRFIKAVRNPLTLLQLAPLIGQYHQELFAALQDYPKDYLRRWDQLCLKAPLTGIAANDAHHNQGVHALIDKQGHVRLEDALGEKLATLDPAKVPLLRPLLLGKLPGQTIFRIDLDPYENSFRHVSTHLLLKKLTEAGTRKALDAGRAYVAFDWLADPTGFVYQAIDGTRIWMMGRQIKMTPGLRLRAAAPLPGTFRLLRNGKEIARRRGREFQFAVIRPGNYRVEVWLTLPDEPKLWILSNPIYVIDRR